MELRHYWQNSYKITDKKYEGDKAGGKTTPEDLRISGDTGEVLYDGRFISEDVYLAVPTFIRRGITITI